MELMGLEDEGKSGSESEDDEKSGSESIDEDKSTREAKENTPENADD